MTRTGHWMGKSHWDADDYFDGSIAYLRVWHGTALSASNAIALYQARQTQDTPVPSPVPTAVPSPVPSLYPTPNCGDGEYLYKLIMYAARVQLCENVIIPSLKNDQWLISDRFFYSTFAYQGGGRELGFEAIQPLHDLCLKGLKPGLVIYMDIDPIIGLERARGRGELDRFELEQIDFFNRIRQAYLDMAEQNPEFVIIDASQSLEQVTQQVKNAVEAYISQF